MFLINYLSELLKGINRHDLVPIGIPEIWKAQSGLQFYWVLVIQVRFYIIANTNSQLF